MGVVRSTICPPPSPILPTVFIMLPVAVRFIHAQHASRWVVETSLHPFLSSPAPLPPTPAAAAATSVAANATAARLFQTRGRCRRRGWRVSLCPLKRWGVARGVLCMMPVHFEVRRAPFPLVLDGGAIIHHGGLYLRDVPIDKRGVNERSVTAPNGSRLEERRVPLQFKFSTL